MQTIAQVERLVTITEDGTLHYFMIGGECIVPNKHTALPYLNEDSVRVFDEIPPNGIFKIIALSWINECTQWVHFMANNGLVYIRDSKMCRTWAIPPKWRTGDLFTWASPFNFVIGDTQYHEVSMNSVYKILEASSLSRCAITNGFNSSYLWERETK